MLCLESLGNFRDGRPIAPWKPAQVKQQQILQRRDPRAANRVFTETQKAPYLVAQLRERFEVLLGRLFFPSQTHQRSAMHFG